jgi:hypothetical protein
MKSDSETERADLIVAQRARHRKVTAAIAVVLIVSLGWNAWQQIAAQTRAQVYQQSAVSLAEQVQHACESQGSLDLDGRDLCQQADDVVEGGTPVPNPGPTVTTTAEPIPVAPTNAQMDSALERYCDTHDCLPGPTSAQVRAALADLCSEIRCRGADGKDSTVPGSPPTDAQLDAAQARYCDAHNECRGPGGANGADGRGLLSMQCAVGGWIVKYTDGLTDDAAGLCQGPQGVHGEQGPASTVPGPEGPQGTAKPGDYACPDGEHMTGFTVAEDGAVTLACQAPTPPVIGPPDPTPSP